MEIDFSNTMLRIQYFPGPLQFDRPWFAGEQQMYIWPILQRYFIYSAQFPIIVIKHIDLLTHMHGHDGHMQAVCHYNIGV